MSHYLDGQYNSTYQAVLIIEQGLHHKGGTDITWDAHEGSLFFYDFKVMTGENVLVFSFTGE